MIEKSDQNFLEMENRIRSISKNSGVKVIGSYNPLKCGCDDDEFFDGMHPKDSCMEKIVYQLFYK